MNEGHNAEIVCQPKRQFKPVGVCIYCGDVSERLQKEHILPYGLAGHSLILQKSSCSQCGAMTGKFEEICLRKTFQSLRTRLELPTRRPNERPVTLPIGRSHFKTMTPGETAVFLGDISIPASQFPLVFVGLSMGPPGVLSGIPKGASLPYRPYSVSNSTETDRYFKRKGNALRLGSVNVNAFVRFLAKVAHSYATAVQGHNTFTPTLLDVIFDRKDCWFRHWIGSSETVPPPVQDELHTIKCDVVAVQNIRYVVVTLRLFSFMPTPVYRVVAGRI